MSHQATLGIWHLLLGMQTNSCCFKDTLQRARSNCQTNNDVHIPTLRLQGPLRMADDQHNPPTHKSRLPQEIGSLTRI